MMMMVKSQLSYSYLPDIVNDCEEKLRLVADQVDKKYCQVSFKYNFFSFQTN